MRGKKAIWGAVSMFGLLLALSSPASAQLINENFDGVAAGSWPAGWTIEDVGTLAPAWNTTTTIPLSSPNSAHIGWNATNPLDDWLYTPGVALTGGTSYRLTFWYRARGFTEAMEVSYGTSASAASMTTQLWDNPSFLSSTYAEVVVDFTPPSDATYYIGFHAYSAANMFGIGVDDVVLGPTPVNPVFGVNPSSHDFGTLDPHYLGLASKMFEITNTGAGTLTISTISVPGTDFRVKNISATLPADLAVGESMFFDVELMATTGSPTADVSIVDNTKATQTVPVQAVVTSYENRNYGGPEGGYFWANSTTYSDMATSQPAFSWIDISGTGTDIVGSFTDDSYGGPYPIGFTFNFFGNDYTEFYLSSNGLISFTALTSSYASNTAIPTAAAPNDMIAWFWDDLNPTDADPGNTHVYYGNAPGGELVIQFERYPRFNADANGWITAEVILYPTGNVKFQYADHGSSFFSIASGTIGLEDSTGASGTQYYYRSSTVAAEVGAPLFGSPLAVEFGTDPASVPVELKSFNVD